MRNSDPAWLMESIARRQHRCGLFGDLKADCARQDAADHMTGMKVPAGLLARSELDPADVRDAPSRVEQCVEVAGAPSQLVRFGRRAGSGSGARILAGAGRVLKTQAQRSYA